MTKILMICMGNICRSPMAEGVLHALAQQQGRLGEIEMDSAGTHGNYHAGEPPDPRAVAVAAKRGYTQLPRQRSRQLLDADFERFDLLIAMDRQNLDNLRRQCPPEHQHKLHLLLEFAPQLGVDEVPDPYYGNVAGFERVLDLCESGVSGLLAHLTGAQ